MLDEPTKQFLAGEINLDLSNKLNEILNTEGITFTAAWATLAALLASTICIATSSRSEVTECAELFGEFVKTFCAETDLGPEDGSKLH